MVPANIGFHPQGSPVDERELGLEQCGEMAVVESAVEFCFRQGECVFAHLDLRICAAGDGAGWPANVELTSR